MSDLDQAPVVERPGLRRRLRLLALDTTPLRRSPAFRRLWLGQTASFVGTEIAYVALNYQVYRLTHSTLAVGLLSLTALVPLLSLTLLGGAIADAMSRRMLMLVQQTGMLLSAVALLVNATLPHPQVWACFLFDFLATSAFGLGVGAQRAMTPQLVPDEQLVAANALNGMIGNLGAVAGPALAGLLIRYVDLAWIYAADAVTYLGTLAAVSLLPRLGAAHDADRPGLRSIADGFRYVRREPVILGFFLVDTNAMIFGMPSALFPALADHRFGDPALVGYLYAAPYAGALLVSLASGFVRHVRRQGRAVVVSAAVWGAAIAAFGFAGELWLALLLLAVAGAADLVSAVFRSTMLLRLAPDELRGRLSGIEFAQVASAPALGNVEAGVVASLSSIRFSIVSGGLACIAGTVLLALAFPALARYDAKADGAAARG